MLFVGCLLVVLVSDSNQDNRWMHAIHQYQLKFVKKIYISVSAIIYWNTLSLFVLLSDWGQFEACAQPRKMSIEKFYLQRLPIKSRVENPILASDGVCVFIDFMRIIIIRVSEFPKQWNWICWISAAHRLQRHFDQMSAYVLCATINTFDIPSFRQACLQ